MNGDKVENFHPNGFWNMQKPALIFVVYPKHAFQKAKSE